MTSWGTKKEWIPNDPHDTTKYSGVFATDISAKEQSMKLLLSRQYVNHVLMESDH